MLRHAKPQVARHVCRKNFHSLIVTDCDASLFVSRLLRIDGREDRYRFDGEELEDEAEYLTAKESVCSSSSAAPFLPLPVINPQAVANQWRANSALARVWEIWDSPLSPVPVPQIPRVIDRMRRAQRRRSSADPFALSWEEAGHSWRIRGHSLAEVRFAKRFARQGRPNVLFSESMRRYRRSLKRAGIEWTRGRNTQRVPPLHWAAARSVQNQIHTAFQQDALRGLPKRPVPEVIRRHLQLAFEGKL